MRRRTRTLVGTALLAVFLVVYALAAMAAAVMLQVIDNRWVEVAYYALAGLLWIFPAGLLIRWMSKRV